MYQVVYEIKDHRNEHIVCARCGLDRVSAYNMYQHLVSLLHSQEENKNYVEAFHKIDGTVISIDGLYRLCSNYRTDTMKEQRIGKDINENTMDVLAVLDALIDNY